MSLATPAHERQRQPDPQPEPESQPVRMPLALRVAAVGTGLMVSLGLAGWVNPFLPDVPLRVSIVGLLVVVIVVRLAARRARRSGRLCLERGVHPLDQVRVEGWSRGGGAFIGIDQSGLGVLHAPAEAACLALGPPRRGKTTSMVIPSVLCAPGAAAVTSTKPDVLLATAAARSRLGRIFVYDPTGHAAADLPDGAILLRWSPLDAAHSWEAARRLAAAMVAASPAAKGSRNESHWTSRAAALLGPLLYAAALSGGDMVDVVTWVLAGDIGPANQVLIWAADHGDPDAVMARKVLAGVQMAADEERQSIWSATADVIDVYTTTQALDAATGSNFDPDLFVASCDTVYIAASAEHQAACAPLVVALIEAIRDAQYRRHRADDLAGEPHGAPVSLILDEVANVAPIASLPGLVSEAGGQGLHVAAAVQDLSQVRGRWGAEVADGFLSLFQHIVVLGGIRDTKTLEALSTICGEWDRPQMSLSRSYSRTKVPGRWRRDRTNSWSSSSSTTRERRLPAGEVYALPDGQALYLYGSAWRMVTLAPHYTHPRWQSALAAGPANIQIREPHLTVEARAAHPAFHVPGDLDVPDELVDLEGLDASGVDDGADADEGSGGGPLSHKLSDRRHGNLQLPSPPGLNGTRGRRRGGGRS